MDLFRHHLYEYWKGLRHLILHTAPQDQIGEMTALLEKHRIPYFVCPLSKGHCNLFFGDSECLDVIRSFGPKPLYDYSKEQDFILGIMLGYDRLVQCRRYLTRNKTLSKLQACNDV